MIATKILLKKITNLNTANSPLDGISGFFYTQIINKSAYKLQEINEGLLHPNTFIQYINQLQDKIRPWNPPAGSDILKRIELSTYLIAYLANYSQTAEKFTKPSLILAVTNLYTMVKECPKHINSIITQTVAHLIKETAVNTQVDFAELFLQKLKAEPFQNSAGIAEVFLDNVIDNVFKKLDMQGQREFVELFLRKLKDAPSKENDQQVHLLLEKFYAFFQPKLIDVSISIEMKQHITTLFKRVAEIFDLERSTLVFTSPNSVIWPNISPRAESVPSILPSQEQKSVNKKKSKKRAIIADISSPTAPDKKNEIIVSTKKSNKSREKSPKILEDNIEGNEIKKTRRIKRRKPPKTELEVQQALPLSDSEPAIKLEIQRKPSIWVETNSTFNQIANTLDAYLKDDLQDSNIIAKESDSTHSPFCQLRDLMPLAFQSKLNEIKSLHNRMQEINDDIEELAPKIDASYRLIEQQYNQIAEKEDLNITDKKADLTELEKALNTRYEQLKNEMTELQTSLSATSQSVQDGRHINALSEISEQDLELQNKNKLYFRQNFKDIPEKINLAFLKQQNDRTEQIQQLMSKHSKLGNEAELNKDKLDASFFILENKKTRLLNSIKEKNEQLVEPQQAIDKAIIENICDRYNNIVSLKETIEDKLPVPLKLLDLKTLSYNQLVSNNNNNFKVGNAFSENDLLEADPNHQQYLAELTKLKQLSERYIETHNKQKHSVDIKFAEYQANYHAEREKLIGNIEQSYEKLSKLADNNNAADFFSEGNVNKMSTADLRELKMSLSDIKLYNEDVISLQKKYELAIINKNLSDLDTAYVNSFNKDVSEFEKQKVLVEKIRLLSEITALKGKLNKNIVERNQLLNNFNLNKLKIDAFTQYFTNNIATLDAQINELSVLKGNLSDYSFKEQYLEHCDAGKKAAFEHLKLAVNNRFNYLSAELNNYNNMTKQVAEALSLPLNANFDLILHNKKQLDYNSGFVQSTLLHEQSDLSTLTKQLDSLAEASIDNSLQVLEDQKVKLNNLINSTYVQLPKITNSLEEVDNNSPAILKVLSLFSQIRSNAGILTDIIVPYTEQETLASLEIKEEQSNDILTNITNLITQQSEQSQQTHNEVDIALRDIKKASLTASKETINAIESKLNARKTHFETLVTAYKKIVAYNASLAQLDALKSTRAEFKQLIDEMNSNLINSIIEKGDVKAADLFIIQRESISEQFEFLNTEIAQFEETQTEFNVALANAFPGLEPKIADIENILGVEAAINNDLETALQIQKNFIVQTEIKLDDNEINVSTVNFDVDAINKQLAKINNCCNLISQEQTNVSKLAANKPLLEKITVDTTALPEKLIYWAQQVNECQNTAEDSAFELKKAGLSAWYAHIVADITVLKNNIYKSRNKYENDCNILGKLPEEVRSKNRDLIKKLAEDFVKTNNMIAKSTHLSTKEKDNLLQEFKEISRNLQAKGIPKARADEIYTNKLESIIRHKAALAAIEDKISTFEKLLNGGVDLSNNKDENSINLVLQKLERHQNELAKYQGEVKEYNFILNNLATVYEDDANRCKNEIKTDLTDTQTAFKELRKKVAGREKEITLNRLSSVRSYSISVALPLLGVLLGAAIGPGGVIVGFALGCAIAAVRVLKRSANNTKPPLEAAANKEIDQKPVRDHFTLFKQKLNQYDCPEVAQPANNVVEPVMVSDNIITVR